MVITPRHKLITYVARDLEPYRGFHIMMRALPRILRERPDVRAVLVGGDGVSYGMAHPLGPWREVLLKELGEKIDPDRVCFPGKIDYATYVRMLQRSDAHVYLSYPFVASWSLREALGTGCAVVGSDTPPVTEFVRNGQNGLIVPFLNSRRSCLSGAGGTRKIARWHHAFARALGLTLSSTCGWTIICVHITLLSGASSARSHAAPPLRHFPHRQLPVRPHEVAGVAVRNALQVILVLGLGLPERRRPARPPSPPCLATGRTRPRRRWCPRRLSSAPRWCRRSPSDSSRPHRCPAGSASSDRGSGRRIPAVVR